MRSALDLSPYRQSSIGFDHLFDMLESTARQGETDGFPPFDLEQHDENTYRIRLAVAGFSHDDLEITAQSNLLVITGRRVDDQNRKYLYRGISARHFQRQFQLADYVIVTGARLRDGLLEVDLKREIPDAIKPRKIEILTANGAQKRTEPAGRRKQKLETGKRERERGETIDHTARTDREKTLASAW